ncbi:MAG TPA: putative LPS assembly protein LptD [Flavobacteriales bacterium]|nr:putative LPS assembly protein LptD [Flavobacteriales bacterium]
MRLRLLITALYTVFGYYGYAQGDTNTLKVREDTTVSKVDTIDQKGFDLESEVNYKAIDSIAFEPDNQLIFLYGKAVVTYEGQTIKAEFMQIDMKNNKVMARGKTDSTGKVIEKVNYTDGENSIDASSLEVDIKSKKGKIKEVFTSDGEMYVHMEEAKKHPNEVHLRNGKFTTCSNEKPHYHFRMRKAIVIPDDKIVTGPVYMVVGKIPTPLALPFGYFPNKKGKVRGILIPQYGDSPTYGFFLQNGGYYLPIGKKMDMQFLGDVYSRGSWALKNITRYKLRYRFNGNVNLSFSQFRTGEKEFPDFQKSNEFFIRWTHNQDPKSRPGSRFTANVNFGTQTNFQNNFNTYAQDYLSSSFQSNVSYTRTWLGTPFSLSTNLRHNQNRLAKTITVTAPELTLNVNRFFPLGVLTKNKVSPGVFARGLANIGVTMSSNMRNDVSAGDSLYSFSNINTLINSHSRNGVKHNAAVSTSMKLFGQRFTFNPSVNMVERWYFQSLNKTYIGSELQTDTLHGFTRNFEYSYNASLTTRIFGMYSGKKSSGPRLRHILTPSINFAYRPNFDFTEQVQVDSAGTFVSYSPFDLGVFGRPSTGESGTIGISLVNSLELKKRSLQDTITGFVKIPIIENFQVNANYDLVKDSLNLSNIQFSARNTFFKVLNIVYSSVLDPYYYENGVITREYYWNKGKGLGRVTLNNLAVNYTFKAKARKPKEKPKELTADEEEELESIKKNNNAYVDFDVPLTISAGYNLNFNRVFQGTLDTVLMTQSIGLRGDIGITRKMKLGYNTNYDFVAKKLSYTELSLYYDLHCWEFSTTVIPFGPRKSYVITLNVKASILQDLRLQRRRSWVDLD